MPRIEESNYSLQTPQQLFAKMKRHIGNVFREKELDEKSNVQILHITPLKYVRSLGRPQSAR